LFSLLTETRNEQRKIYLTLFSVLIIAILIAAVSCGKASQPTAQTTTQPEITQPVTIQPATTKPTTTQPTTTAPGTTAAVVIENYAYSPATLTVAAGTMVTWTNKDSVGHTVTTRTPLFDSGLFGKDKSYSYTFTQKGSYEYYCIPHPYMAGKVIVE
jgi:plastocyanin